ncbi:MAG: diacylglycerol kinase family lipid kinase [Deltaproteobacteria bacterium]|nr:diacylglycerol kinase family lipid kinase [Deltaproteobacteria bacterium]
MDHFKTVVIVNPNSGGGSTGRHEGEIKDEVRRVLPDAEFADTAGPGDATILARKALKAGAEMVVAVGGDGTNNEVINGFFEDGAPINPDAVFFTIPRGTGGDFRKTAGIPNDVQKACAMLPGRNAHPIDVGHMTLVGRDGKPTERYFINIASCGVGGKVADWVERLPKSKLGGKATFFYATIRAMLEYHNAPVRIRVDDKDLGEMRIFSMAIANGQFFGGGMHFAPMAALDDGLFDVVIMGDLSRWQKWTQGASVYKGEHLKKANVEHHRAKRVEVTSEEKVYHEIDGEGLGTLPSVYTLLPGAVRLKQAP